ncbi:MAG: hypothetical protein ACI9R3_006547 [Verrucomicrobiales bacterium]|jgi:hypothetical protein
MSFVKKALSLLTGEVQLSPIGWGKLLVKCAVAVWRVRGEFAQCGLQRELSSSAALQFDQTSLTDKSAAWQLAYADTVTRVVRVMVRIFLSRRNTCLFRALVARRVLWDRGIAVRLVIGATTPAVEAFHAHAWIEVCGRAIGEGDGLSNYVTLEHPFAD